jgi:hypothetical protein
MINVWTKYGEHSLYGNGETDLITKTYFQQSIDYENKNEVKVRLCQPMPYWLVPSMINVWTKYGKPSLYGNGETDLITKTWHKFACTLHDQWVDQIRTLKSINLKLLMNFGPLASWKDYKTWYTVNT